MTTRPAVRGPVEELLRHRRLGGHMLWICGLAAIMLATLQPSSQTLTSTRWCVVCGSFGGVDVVLNLFLFMPLGCGLAMVGVRPVRAIAAMALLTLTIETLQFALIAGRDASISDLLTNSVGGAIGFVLGASIETWLTPTPRGAARLMGLWLFAWVSIQFISGYSLIPATTSPRYYGQIKRSLGGRPPYAGDVALATIDGQPIPNTSYDRAGLPQPALSNREGAVVRIDVVPRGPTRRMVPIVRIADEALEETMVLGQHGTHLVFGIRTGAANLHLRPVYFTLRNVFPRARADTAVPLPRDTIRIEARYAASDVYLSADIGAAHHEARIRVSPVIGWRLILPQSAYADTLRRTWYFTAIWLAMLLTPVGYWYVFSKRDESPGAQTRRRISALAASFAVLFGLVGVPLVFGLALPGIAEWSGAGFAIAAGVAIARAVLLR